MTNLRWSIIGLALVGVVAAFCAALLVASLRHNPAHAARGNADRPVHILVANRAIQAMDVIRSNDVTVKTIEAREAPQDFLSDPVQVIGKVLSFPVMEGQALTVSDVTERGPGARLASALPSGMRAVNVAPVGYSRLKDLLYPGCSVDVLCTFRATGKNRQAVSKTLLQNIKVLAVEGQTELSSLKELRDSRDRRRSNKESIVTLMVKAKQAEILHLAIENGTISLAMRNPRDGKNSGAGKLTRLDDVVGLKVPKKKTSFAEEYSERMPAVTTDYIDPMDAPSDPSWETTILRGTSREVRSLPLQNENRY